MVRRTDLSAAIKTTERSISGWERNGTAQDGYSVHDSVLGKTTIGGLLAALEFRHPDSCCPVTGSAVSHMQGIPYRYRYRGSPALNATYYVSTRADSGSNLSLVEQSPASGKGNSLQRDAETRLSPRV